MFNHLFILINVIKCALLNEKLGVTFSVRNGAAHNLEFTYKDYLLEPTINLFSPEELSCVEDLYRMFVNIEVCLKQN